MNFKVNTRYEELTLTIKILTRKESAKFLPCRIRIKVFDAEHPLTIFTDRYKTVAGMETFYIRMPLSSKNAVIAIYNEANGNLSSKEDTSFSVLKIDKIPLEKRTDVADIRDIKVKSFVDFAQRFAFNASYMEANKSYQSMDGKYLIEYLPEIISSKTKKPLKTPARISNINGRIQVSKKAFNNYTVPMRMMILLHEFSHFYLNKDKHNEMEADLNGLLIYLSLGYPRIEAHQAFLEVFIGTPSTQNKERFDLIETFIMDFENKKIVWQ
jgi:hypothetical protein